MKNLWKLLLMCYAITSTLTSFKKEDAVLTPSASTQLKIQTHALKTTGC